MITITKTKDLEEFCDHARNFSYITIDTEFLREKTYFAKLCLVQLALPGNAKGNVVLVDPLTEDELSFEPLLKLFTDKEIIFYRSQFRESRFGRSFSNQVSGKYAFLNFMVFSSMLKILLQTSLIPES